MKIYDYGLSYFYKNYTGYNDILKNGKTDKTGIFKNMEIYARYRYSRGIFRN